MPRQYNLYTNKSERKNEIKLDFFFLFTFLLSVEKIPRERERVKWNWSKDWFPFHTIIYLLVVLFCYTECETSTLRVEKNEEVNKFSSWKEKLIKVDWFTKVFPYSIKVLSCRPTHFLSFTRSIGSTIWSLFINDCDSIELYNHFSPIFLSSSCSCSLHSTLDPNTNSNSFRYDTSLSLSTGNVWQLNFSPILALLIAIVVILVIISFVILIIVKVRSSSSGGSSSSSSSSHSNQLVNNRNRKGSKTGIVISFLIPFCFDMLYHFPSLFSFWHSLCHGILDHIIRLIAICLAHLHSGFLFSL